MGRTKSKKEVVSNVVSPFTNMSVDEYMSLLELGNKPPKNKTKKNQSVVAPAEEDW